jgi:hypothetical protein
MRRNMNGNGLSELNGSMVAAKDDPVADCHGGVVHFSKSPVL